VEYLQFFAKRTSVEAPVFVIFLLLLMPSFLVISQNRVAAPSPPVATSSPQPSIVSTPNPVSTYKSLGLANPSMSVLVSVEIPLRNLPLLSSYVKQSSDPSSANFRHFLSSSQVSQMFLPTASQYNSVADYLTTSGFTLVSSALNSMIVVRDYGRDKALRSLFLRL